MLNLLPVNGPGQTLWVHRALAVAVATATVTPVAFEYFQSSYAQATATATSSVAAGRVFAVGSHEQCQAAGNVLPTLAYAGSSTGNATAFGLAAVRRDVPATASATGTCVASALLASDIGEVLAFPQPWVVTVGGGLNGVSFSYLTERGGATALGSAAPTKRHPGTALGSAAAQAEAGSADVVRYALVADALGASLYTRAEASYMSAMDNGLWNDDGTWIDGGTWEDDGFYYHDGFVPGATAASTASIDNSLVTLIETIGPYNLGQSYAVSCVGTLRQPATATASGVVTGLADESWTSYAHAQANAQASAVTTTAVRTVFPAATRTAGATAPRAKAAARYASRATATVAATTVPPIAVRTCFGEGLWPATVTGTATPGNQYRATPVGNGQATGTSAALQTFVGSATGTGAVTSAVDPADFYRVIASGVLANGAGLAVGVLNHATTATGTGTAASAARGLHHPGQASAASAAATGSASAVLVYQAELAASSHANGQAAYATQRWGLLEAAAGAAGTGAASMNYRGWVTASAGATATVTAFANSDVLAPDCRYLTVAADDRVMTLEADDRLLMVTCG